MPKKKDEQEQPKNVEESKEKEMSVDDSKVFFFPGDSQRPLVEATAKDKDVMVRVGGLNIELKKGKKALFTISALRVLGRLKGAGVVTKIIQS